MSWLVGGWGVPVQHVELKMFLNSSTFFCCEKVTGRRKKCPELQRRYTVHKQSCHGHCFTPLN